MTDTPETFDAVIVGSGFGGSATALRLAEEGWSVLVLERGRAYPPDSFPRTPRGYGRNFWDPAENLYGMFDVWSFRRLDAVVSSGLGGGSLIYANVMLRKPERWFVQEGGPGDAYEHWPVTAEQLEDHYDRIEALLGATPYPYGEEPYASTRKTAAFREAAELGGLDCHLPNLAVTFAGADGRNVPGAPVEPPVPSLHGLPRSTCTLCGECDVGCNVGAKNTLDHTILSAAAVAGAQIRTCCEVRTLTPQPGGGWEVGVREHEAARIGHATEWPGAPAHVRARHVVLAAGTLGTNHLLLRHQGLLPLSPRLGDRVSANGDLLAFAVNARHDDGRPRALDPSRGPVITSTVVVPDARDGDDGDTADRGFYVQDGGYPVWAEWLTHLVDVPGDLWDFRRTAVRHIVDGLRKRRDTNLSAEISAMLGDARTSAGTLPLLGMGRDLPDGRMTLNGKRLECDWSIDASRAYYERMVATMRELAAGMGAELTDTAIGEMDRLAASHPLGGCAMGREPWEGVVDDQGRVFGCDGLHIADGSVMPGPVGPNPGLTIAALADRFAVGMVEREKDKL